MDSRNNKKIFIGGNWKSNGDVKFVAEHVKFLNGVNFDLEKCEVAICPTFIHIPLLLSHLDNKYIISSQNVSAYDNGAQTGEVSARQLKDLGVNWTLIGHSERRQFHGETEDKIAKKIKQSLDQGLNVIACVGELLTEREANQTIQVISSQLKTLFEVITEWSRVVIAYEPVWAIGTGKTASPKEAQEVHAEIRKLLAVNINESTANQVRIIYGGSVTDQNCNELIKENDVDGFLVGGASLKSAFQVIIESYKSKSN